MPASQSPRGTVLQTVLDNSNPVIILLAPHWGSSLSIDWDPLWAVIHYIGEPHFSRFLCFGVLTAFLPLAT